MDLKEKELLKQTMVQEIDKLKADITEYEKIIKPIAPDNAIGRITRMDAISRKSINEAAMNNAKNSLNKLQQGLLRIDEPDFGICKRCSKPIPVERLMAMPGTALCINCISKG